MGLRINQNIDAFNSYRNLSVTQGAMSKSLEKLSSGFRINRAADDAAGLAISEGLRSQVGGLKVAVRNAQDGVSVVQTAEGALTETHSILQRMRDLAVQASNDGALSDTDKAKANKEFVALRSELDDISKTQFNGTTLLDGTYSKSFQVGANSGDTLAVAISDMSSTGLAVNANTIDTAANAGAALTAIDDASERYPLLVGELSYRPGLTCQGGQLCPEWRELIERFPTRFMVGSDTWINERWSSYDEIMRNYRVWLGALPPELAQRIAWGNAAALFGLKAPSS